MTTHEILLAAQAAKLPLALADTDTKNAALEAMAVALVENSDAILAANKQDLAAARGRISDVMLDRLALTPARLAAMAKGMREVAALPDPVGAVLRKIVRPNGLLIEKTSVPMGVIAIIYESRPNVTSDAAAIIPGTPAGEQDIDTEFLNYILAIAVVDDVDAAIAHIARHSTHHSEAIITADDTAADRFTTCVDSAAVYVNASTRFTDGGEFGLGCEMGISTQKLHARGPMGLAELCSYKYIIHGSGQTRGGSAAKLQNPCN